MIKTLYSGVVVHGRNYNKEMDCCLRASSILYTRLYESSERVYMANRRPVTRLSKNREIPELLG